MRTRKHPKVNLNILRRAPAATAACECLNPIIRMIQIGYGIGGNVYDAGFFTLPMYVYVYKFIYIFLERCANRQIFFSVFFFHQQNMLCY